MTITGRNAKAEYGLGLELAERGEVDLVMAHFARRWTSSPALPRHTTTWAWRWRCAARPACAAVAQFVEAVVLKPDHVAALSNLERACRKPPRRATAVGTMPRPCPQGSVFPAHCCLADILLRAGQTVPAVAHLEEALRSDPADAAVRQHLAWLLAALEPDQGGDPQRAVPLAEAARWAKNPAAECLDVLAAQASFPEATAEEAKQSASRAGATALADQIEARLVLYRRHRPYRLPRGAGLLRGRCRFGRESP